MITLRAAPIQELPVTPSVPTMPSASPPQLPCDPTLNKQKATALAAVTIGVLKAQAAILAKKAANQGALFNQLAADTRTLGQVEGKLDACKPSTKSAEELRALWTSNLSTMTGLEARLTQAWLDQDFSMWMALRKQLETYHRVTTAYQAWLAAAPAPAPIKLTLGPISIQPTQPPVGPEAVPPPPMLPPPVTPFYKRPVVLAVAGGALLLLFLRRKA